ncbi:SDR family NAD(P)-dependent oxidoreductase, partial [Mycobacterium kansasii]
WTRADIPDQSGRVAVVTGANTGLGYHTAAVLAFRGAHVVLAVRNLEKGNAALARIVAAAGQNARKVDVTLQQLDLSSLGS